MPSTTKSFVCVECHTIVGGYTGIDVHKHLLQCFHLTNAPVDEIRQRALSLGTAYGQKVADYIALMDQED